jgi:hypothetical protein
MKKIKGYCFLWVFVIHFAGIWGGREEYPKKCMGREKLFGAGDPSLGFLLSLKTAYPLVILSALSRAACIPRWLTCPGGGVMPTLPLLQKWILLASMLLFL